MKRVGQNTFGILKSNAWMTKRTQSNEKRTALLEATLKLVNNNGFHAAPMSKIAKMAGISPGTIYIYFKNKQDLINQLYLEIKASFSEHAFKNFNSDLPTKEGFEIVWYNIADYKFNKKEEAIFLSQCDNTPMINEKSRQEGLKNLQPLLNLWERGKREKTIKPMSPYLLYAFTIYPMAFLLSIQQRNYYQVDKASLKAAFKSAWDGIKM